MATSKTNDNDEEHIKEELPKLLKMRAILKGQFTKAKRMLEGTLSTNEVKAKVEVIEEYWDRYQKMQDEIDSLIDESKVDDEINYRCTIEDEYLHLKTTLNDMLQQSLPLLQGNLVPSTFSSSRGQSSNPHLPYVASLNFTPIQQDETFTNFIRRLEVFLHLKSDELDPKLKVYTFLHALSPQLHQQLYDICAPENPLDKTYTELVTLLRDSVEPKPSVWALQHKFITRTQQEFESINDFSVTLKKLTVNCDFNCECGKCVAEMFLRLQFIRGLRDGDIRTKLLQDQTKMSYKGLVQLAISMELAKSENRIISTSGLVQNGLEFENVQKSDTYKVYKATPPKAGSQILEFDKLKGKCYRCGSTKHRANKCKYIDTMCNKCNKIGHLQSVCLQSKNKIKKNMHQGTMNESEDQDEHEIYKLSDYNNDKFIVSIDIEGRSISMELDTGAALSTISYKDFKTLNLQNRIFSTNVELKTYTGELIKPRGVVFVNCKYKQQFFVGKLYLINQTVDPIFGRDWLREIKLDWAEIKACRVAQPTGLDDLLKKFSDVFENRIGSIPDELAHFRIIEDAKPIFIKPRIVPYALKDKVEKELKRLEEAGILTKVEHSDWGTPIVPIVKPNGNVRICADYKVTINKVIKDEKYPIPRIEDIFAQMNGGKLFCTLDVSNAYLHMNMSEESAKMQTLSTQHGLYRVNRLMFGVKVAPSIWQRFMDKTLQGISNVQCFFDDIVVQGNSPDDLLSKLNTVLERLRSKNLKLNRDKCKFFQKSIEYLGHKIDEHGLHKTQEKVKAIISSKRPTDVSELRTFLGLANYYNKFIKDLASKLFPLNQLLQKGKPFNWTSKCEESFNKVKQDIVSDNVLVHFNPELPLVLATDASPVGLGAVLSHRYNDGTERPISFASRTLTPCERKYSQIDKEATGIYWGLKKFFSYCYGRKFILVTDHKPLVSIFHPHKNLPSISATRIFNYAHFLSGFDYSIEYRKSDEHCNADFLSRFPIEYSSNNMDDSSCFQIGQLQSLLVDSKMIAEETAKDEYLSPVLDALQNGKSVEQFGFHDSELGLQDGCILKGWRILVPKKLQQQVLNELHIGHLGIVRMKALARSHCTWKNIDKDIEEVARSCKQCCLRQNVPAKELSHPWQTPKGTWDRIHIDFAGPNNGQYYFIVVDAFSKWVEVIPTRVTSTDWCVKELRKLFSTFGLPAILISDNGAQFTSYIFKQFLKENGVIHKTTAPHHPSSNGQAERFVQTVKNSLRAMQNEGGKTETNLYYLLMQLRQAVNSTGSTSYQLMFGRPVRTHLALLHPREKQEENNVPFAGRHFKIGDRVQARDYSNAKSKWKFGKVIGREGNLIYKIRMDDGVIWRRHLNQMLHCKINQDN